MSGTYRDGRRKPKPRRRLGVRLNLEELEGRCLLSNGSIIADPHGNLCFEELGSRIGELNPSTGVIQQFNVPGSPMFGEITIDQSGNLWFSQQGFPNPYDQIDELNPNTGTVQKFPLPFGGTAGMGVSITVAPDGKIWFPFGEGGRTYLGQLDPHTGQIQQFILPMGTQYGADIVAAPDGKIWFTGVNDPRVGAVCEMDPSTGAIQQFSTPGGTPYGLAVGSNGLIWFALQRSESVLEPPYGLIWYDIGYSNGTIDPGTGQVNEFNLATGYGNYGLMTAASDGNVFFAGWTAAALYAIEEVNSSTGFVKVVAAVPAGPGGMAATPDGNLWFDSTGTVVEFNSSIGTFQFFKPAASSANGGSSTPSASNSSVSASGASVSATAGIYFVSAVATFTPQTPIASPGRAYQITVDWGDGTTASIVLSVSQNGTYDVAAPHTYQTAGTYTIKVTIGNFDPANPLGDNPITVFSTANVDPFNLKMV